jgi:hypothetical protein
VAKTKAGLHAPDAGTLGRRLLAPREEQVNR